MGALEFGSQECVPSSGTSRQQAHVNAPPERMPSNSNCVRRLRAPAYGLKGAPVVFYKTLDTYLLDAKAAGERMDHIIKVSAFRPCPHYMPRTDGHSAEALATRSDDILGRGGQKVLPTLQEYPESRLKTLVHSDVELPQYSEFSVAVTQKGLPDELELMHINPTMRADRRRALP